MKKRFIAIALIAVLACVSVVAADESGIITINIANSSNSQVGFNVSNSTIQAETNFTNSQAWENITLTNSTLTLNVNGQNITISSQGGNVIISTQNQTATINPNTAPELTVAFLSSEPTPPTSPGHIFLAGNNSIEYDFNVTVSVPTSMNYPFGVNVTHSELNLALSPLVDKYNLVAHSYSNGNVNGNQTTGNGTSTSALWINEPIVSGMNTFSLFSYNQLNADQTEALTNDLFNAFTVAMNGDA